MTIDLTNPIFHDEDAARAHLEAIRWPDGPVCPHCGNADSEQDHAASGQVSPAGPVPVQRMPRAFHRHGRRRHGAVAYPAAQMGSRLPSDGGEQEGHYRPPALSDARLRLLPHRLVHGASHPRSHEDRRRAPIRLAARARLSRPTKPISVAPRTRAVVRTASQGRPYMKRKKARLGISAPLSPLSSVAARFAPSMSRTPPRRKSATFWFATSDRKSALHTDESRLYTETGTEFADTARQAFRWRICPL